MIKEFVIQVDENDNQIGCIEKMEAHKKALLHRAISVFVFNSNGEWLLQRRALDKYHSNGLWTNTCCSHPRPGESCLEAANRRLLEEMGMTCRLREIFCFIYNEKLDNGLTEYEFDHVFTGITDDVPVLNVKEAIEWRYIAFSKLEDEIKKNPGHFTVWFRKIFHLVNNSIQHGNIISTVQYV